MTQRNLGIVLLKVLGVVCVVKAIESAATISSMVVAMTAEGPGGAISVAAMLPFTIPVLSSLAFAFILLCRCEVLAGKLFPAEDAAFPEGAAPADEWYVFAFTVLGAYLLVWHVPLGLAQCVSNFIVSAAGHGEPFPTTARRHAWEGLFRVAMQLGLGFYLIVGGRGIVALVRKLRRPRITGDETT